MANATLPTSPTTGADTWLELSGLARLRRDANQHDPAAVHAVAKQFEALFLGMMLKSMRKASGKDPLFGSSTLTTYREVLDQQLAQDLAARGGFGIARVLQAQIARYAGSGGTPSLAPGDGASGGASPTGATVAPDATPPGAGASAPGQEATVGASAAVQGPAGADGAAAPIAERVRAFVRSVWPDAVRAAHHLGVPPKVLVAQAALESGWGAHVTRTADGASTHNLFGIKADAGWKGPSAEATTIEYRNGILSRERARFRAYPSAAASFADYARFVQSHPRYREALAAARVEGAAGYVRALHRAGYATDPRYAEKVLNVMRDAEAAATGGASVRL